MWFLHWIITSVIFMLGYILGGMLGGLREDEDFGKEQADDEVVSVFDSQVHERGYDEKRDSKSSEEK